MSGKTLILVFLASLLAACTAAPMATQFNINQAQTDAVATYKASLPQNTAVVLPTLRPTAGSTNTVQPPAVTPTATTTVIPLPTLRPTATVYVPASSADGIHYHAGDHASYSSQTPGDWPVLNQAEMIVVSWTLLNDGSTTWDENYSLRWVSGEKVWDNSQVKLMSTVEPGETGSAAINLYAPEKPGNYITYWALFNPAGKQIYQVYFAFVVK